MLGREGTRVYLKLGGWYFTRDNWKLWAYFVKMIFRQRAKEKLCRKEGHIWGRPPVISCNRCQVMYGSTVKL